MTNPSLLAALSILLLLSASLPAADSTPAPAADEEAAYTAAITGRAEKHVSALKLEDPAKAAEVRDIIVKQYRSLRDIHDARDAKLKALPAGEAGKVQADAIKVEADAALKPLHERFISELSEHLTEAQVEQVKDEMTYNVVRGTYDGFLDMIPQLTDAQKQYILAQLKEAREIAMDQGSSNAKHGVFGKYKGRINNYLSKEGYDLKKLTKEWHARLKERQAAEKETSK